MLTDNTSTRTTDLPHAPGHIGEGSLVDPALLAEVDARRAAQHPHKRPPRERWDKRLDRKLRAALAAWWRRPRLRWSTLGALFAIAAVSLFFALRPTPIPDYDTAPMDELLEFTLLTDDFNSLPVDQRLDLLGDLIKRLKTMGSGDSVLMAQFAAAIEGNLRDQLMENASRLVMDVWDKHAIGYAGVPEAERGDYLDKTYLELMEMMETLAGVESEQTDEERLKFAREQAARDEQMFKSGEGPPVQAMAVMASVLRSGFGEHSSPQQQMRGQQLMRDMTRHFRGQDPATGRR